MTLINSNCYYSISKLILYWKTNYNTSNTIECPINKITFTTCNFKDKLKLQVVIILNKEISTIVTN